MASPDILFISIGGGPKSYTGEEASQIVKELNPKIVKPVHFLDNKENNQNCDFSNADEFLENMPNFNVKYVGRKFTINPDKIDEEMIYIFK